MNDQSAKRRYIKISEDQWVEAETAWTSGSATLPELSHRFRKRLAGARPGSMFRLSFDGPALTMTNGIRGLAQEIHERARKAVQEARQRPSAPETPQAAPASSEPVSEPVTLAPMTWIGSARIYTASARSTLAGQVRPLATARSRGPPNRRPRMSARPDPPLSERLLIRDIAEDELPALTVA